MPRRVRPRRRDEDLPGPGCHRASIIRRGAASARRRRIGRAARRARAAPARTQRRASAERQRPRGRRDGRCAVRDGRDEADRSAPGDAVRRPWRAGASRGRRAVERRRRGSRRALEAAGDERAARRPAAVRAAGAVCRRCDGTRRRQRDVRRHRRFDGRVRRGCRRSDHRAARRSRRSDAGTCGTEEPSARSRGRHVRREQAPPRARPPAARLRPDRRRRRRRAPTLAPQRSALRAAGVTEPRSG